MSDVPADNPISTTDLDTEFPVPGQDNDSQGFRDNFTVINENFVAAKARLEDLETYSVRNEASTTFLPIAGGGTARLINPTLDKPLFTKVDITDKTDTTANINFTGDAGASYQRLTLTDNTELDIVTSPESGYYGKIVLNIETDGVEPSYNLTWNEDLTIKFDSDSEDFWNRDTTGESTILSNTTYIIELWTYQGSTTYFAKYIGSFS